MQGFTASIVEAFRLVVCLDAGLLEIVWLSMQVSLTAVLISAIIGSPMGAFLAVTHFLGEACSSYC